MCLSRAVTSSESAIDSRKGRWKNDSLRVEDAEIVPLRLYHVVPGHLERRTRGDRRETECDEVLFQLLRCVVSRGQI